MKMKAVFEVEFDEILLKRNNKYKDHITDLE